MTQENKELLLKEICTRLPYGIKVQIEDEICTLGEFDYEALTCGVKHQDGHFSGRDIDEIQLFLRSMSSMTDEEKDYIVKLAELPCAAQVCEKKVDFFNSHYIDWRNLIPKGLALEAPENMYNINY